MPHRARLKEKFSRYRQVGNILAKHGFGIILERTHLFRFLHVPLRKTIKRESRPLPERIRTLLEELGPTFIKLGQILSTRPDLIPFSFVQELEKLQDDVQTKVEELEAVFRQELGKPPEEIFAWFDTKPIASASVSQVHKAQLKDGRTVAVKIQRPGIERLVQVDMQILYDIAGLMEKFIKEAQIYQPVKIVTEFERAMRRELDFVLEARNIERFRRNFSSEPGVYVPRVYREFTTRRLLTLEYVEGAKITNQAELENLGVNKKDLALTGARATLKQIFSDGFFHADPHPGNLLVLKDGRICYLDFGIVGRLGEERKTDLIFLLQGFLTRDPDKVLRALAAMRSLKEELDTEGLKREIEDNLDRFFDIPLGELRVQDILEEAFDIMRRFVIQVPADLSLLAKALITTEGVGRYLDPDFNFTEELRPFLARLLSEKFRPANLNRLLKRNLTNFYFLVRELPGTVDAVLRSVKRGTLNMTFEHQGLQHLTSTMDKASNRISFSLIVAALLVASSFIIVSGKGPLVMGFPALGIFGFILAGILGLWLLTGIMKGGRL